ncbi:MAG TPA: daunorubicin ABC transporter ATP-binding protein, partial [Actinomycetota bacterium]|nr:daunorubicin ABC transporter ATP-binding protein [Actinomycetota bacterium]
YMEEADQLAGRIAIIDNGHIVADGTPSVMKAKVGDPTLRVAIGPEEDRIAVEAALLECGEPAPGSADYVAIRLKGGASRIAAVARTLEDAGIAFTGLELLSPSLDDVFQQATGRRLEGAAEPEAAPAR